MRELDTLRSATVAPGLIVGHGLAGHADRIFELPPAGDVARIDGITPLAVGGCRSP